jgi:hypothetical protein
MSYESPNLNLFSTDGYEVPVQNNVATPVGTRGIIAAGSDGTVTRFNLVDSSGRQIIAGAGTAGTPSAGVLTIQGIASGTPIPISGTISATNPSVGTVATTPPTSATYVSGSVTTSAPTYTTGQLNPLSLTTSGALRIDGSSTTQPVSGTVNIGSNPDISVSGTINATDSVVPTPTGNGALLSGTPTAGSYVVAASTGGFSAWAVDLIGSLGGGTIYYELSLDSTNGIDGNWIVVNGRQTGVTNTVLGFSTNVAGTFRGNVSAAKYFRVRITGATSPSVTTVIRLSSGTGAVFLNSSLPTGNNTIGTVNLGSQPDLVAYGTINATDAAVGAPSGSGSLLSGTSTTGSYVSLASTGGFSGWAVQLSGSFGGGTIYYEISLDSTTGVDGNWITVNGRQTGITNTVLRSGTTTAGDFRGNIAGAKYFRVRMVGATSPSVGVVIRLSAGTGAVFLNASIPAGTNAIGIVSTQLDDVVSGTFNATGQSQVYNVDAGRSSISWQFVGTWTGTINFEKSVNGVDYVPMSFFNGTDAVNSTTTNGVFYSSLGSTQYVRIRTSNTWTGTVSWSGARSVGVKSVAIQDSLPTGTNNIGNVGLTSDTTSTGTITATGQNAVINLVPGWSSTSWQFTGAWTGTINFEKSVDGSNWTTMSFYDAVASNATNSVTGNGIYFSSAGALESIRIRSSGTWTGTLTWTNARSFGNKSITIQDALPSGTNTIGNINIASLPQDANISGTLNGLNSNIQLTMSGYNTAGFQLSAGTLIGTIVAEVSLNGGTTWNTTYFDQVSGSKVSSLTFSSANTAVASTIVGVGGAGLVRVRVSAYTSGSASIALRATTATDPSVLFTGVPSLVAPPVAAQIGGKDATGNIQVPQVDNILGQTVKQISTAATITSPGAAARGGYAYVNAYGTLRVSDEPITLFSENFDQGIDVNKWNVSKVSGGGSISFVSTDGIVSSSTSANAYAVLTSVPTFQNYGLTFLAYGAVITVTGPTTGSYRFFGVGTTLTTPAAPAALATTSTVLIDAIGFELDVAGNFYAVIFAAGTCVYRSTALTVPTSTPNRFGFQLRADVVIFYESTTEYPVASVNFINPNNTVLPAVALSVNGGTTLGSASIIQIQALGISDSGNNSGQLSDGTYPWKKATVTAMAGQTQQQLSVAATLTSPAAGAAGLYAQPTVYGTLKVSPEPTALFVDTFDGTVIDTTTRWTQTTSNGGTISLSTSQVSMAVTTAKNSTAILTTQPAFSSNGFGFLYFGCIKKFPGTNINNTHQYWGWGTTPAAGSTALIPVQDGAGFEIDLTGNFNATIWASGVKTYSSPLVKPTDGLAHRYSVLFRADTAIFYVDNLEVPVLVVPYQFTTNTTLPIRFSIINSASTFPSAGTTVGLLGAGVGDSTASNMTLSDGTYPWRKANINATGQLSVVSSNSDIFSTGTISAASSFGVIANYSATVPTANSYVSLTLSGHNSVDISVPTGTWTGTLTTEATTDGTNWFTVGGAGSVGHASSITSISHITFNSATWTQVRLRAVSGTTFSVNPAVRIAASYASAGEEFPTLSDVSNVPIGSLADGSGLNGLAVALGATSFPPTLLNNITTQLASGATFTGGVETCYNTQTISILMTSDQPGALTVNQYIDAAGTRLASSWVSQIAAGVGFSRSYVANGNFFNLSFHNTGGSATTTLNINSAFGILPPSTNFGNTPVSLNEINGVATVVSTDGRFGVASSLQLTTSAVTSVASSATVVTLLALNTSRRTAIIVNDSTSILYIKFGSGASLTSYTYRIPSYGTIEIDDPVYTGIVTGIWSSANGSARITELAL